MRKHQKENYWISLSDMMTGLMVIFMFIAISYVSEIKAQQEDRNKILEEFKQVKIALYLDLKKEFEDDFKEDKWNASLDEDLSIRFLNERVLFGYDSDVITQEFKSILDDFFSRYMAIVMRPIYKNKIAEIRIEGHSDSRGDYMYNVNLSQRRTANVLDYVMFRGKSTIQSFTDKEKELIRFWLTANGFSYGRTVDSSGEYTIKTGNKEDRDRSRRVEFRIITKTDELVKTIMKQLEEEQ